MFLDSCFRWMYPRWCSTLCLASYPGSQMMWGRKREPGDYCAAHAPNVYANLSRICRIFYTIWWFAISHVISDVTHDTRVPGNELGSTVQRARRAFILFHDTRVPGNEATCSDRGDHRPEHACSRKGKVVSVSRHLCRSQLANKQRRPFRHTRRKLLPSARFLASGLIAAHSLVYVIRNGGILRDYKIPRILGILAHAQCSSHQALFSAPTSFESLGTRLVRTSPR